MAQQINNVLQGQVTPQARPVDAFIRPGETNVAQPNQLPRLGQPSQINTISTGGTNNVAGVNKFAQLAQDLAEFNPQLTKSLQTMGVMYADSQMQAGERYAKEQALKALANNDNQMEAAELDRAAQNRRLGAKDPNAGTIMASLNPYFGMGVERGNAKLAADRAEIGLPAYIAKNRNKIDYNAPDQGFGALVQLQAQYTQELAQDWGLSAGSPGFQKYTLPSIEKARDRISQQHIQDRKNYFDTVGVQQTVAQIRQSYLTTEAAGVITVEGRTYSRAENPERFREMQQYRGQQILDNLLLRQSLPGEASKRSEDVYAQLSKIADYGLDDSFNKFVNSIPSQQVLKDENGKAVVNPKTGQPFMLTWGEVYQSTSIDSEMKYEKAGLERRKEKLLESVGGFEEGLLNAVSGLAPGPEQEAAASSYTRKWYEENGREQGISLVELQRRRADVVKLDDNIYSEGQDQNIVPSFYTELNQSYGSEFNATRWRQRMNDVAAAIRDPKERTSFLKDASSNIASREREMATFSGYSSTRDKTITEIVNANLASNYNVSQAGDNPRLKANIEESKVRQRTVVTQRANDLIAKEEAKLKRRLTDTEVRALSRAAFFGDKALGIPAYGEGGGGSGKSGLNQKDYLFPGSKRGGAPDAPDPSGRARPGRMYELEQLGNIQNKAALKAYRDAGILTPDATLKAWEFVKSGKALPPQLDRAWRQAGARSAADFVLGQMDYHRRLLSSRGADGDDLEKFNPSPAERSKVMGRSTRAAAGGATAQSVSSNVQSTPMLAQLGGWALNALTGAAPAAAATMPQQMPTSGRVAGRPPVGGSRPPQPKAYPLPDSYPGLGEAPAAPVLPAPGGSRAAGAVMEPARGGGGSEQVAMASPIPQLLGGGGGGGSRGGAVRPAPLPGWGVDADGNLISPTEGRPTVPDPVMSSPRLRAVRADYGPIGGGGFEKPVSVVFERSGGQPGVDLYFPSKRFPAVLGGVVKDVSRQGGAGSGYGNFVVIESIDPLTGKRVDVLYGHLADGVKVRPGQRIEAGQIIGQQGGTGRVVSQDGTIASIDFFAPRPAGSKDMTPYSGFDRLRRHVVSTLEQGGGGGAVGGQKPDGYLKRLAHLETRIRNIPNAEGSPGRGYFQAFPPFAKEAIAASGGIDPRDADYGRSAKATWAWIQKHRPEAAAAIKRGDYETADRILRPTWPSLPGGSQAQPDYVQREARRYLN